MNKDLSGHLDNLDLCYTYEFNMLNNVCLLKHNFLIVDPILKNLLASMGF